MSRRGRRQVADFLTAFQQTYSLMQGIQKDRAVAEVADAKPVESQGFTAEQGETLRKAGEAGAQIDYDQDQKAYVVQPKIGDGQGMLKPEVIAQHGVTDFLGQRQAGSMTPDQINAARETAMAGVISRYDPAAGARMRRDVQLAQRDDKRFAWEKARAGREERLASEQEEERAFTKGLDADVGKWFQTRLQGENGQARAATIDDHLAASQYRAARLTQAGKMDQAGQVLKEHGAASFAKIQLEGAQRDQALGATAAAVAAGDLNAAKDFFNRYVPDGSRVLDVSRAQGGQITIRRETMDGRPMPDMVMKDAGQLTAGLAAFKDPMAIYNWSQNEFKNTLALRADARADKSLAIQAATAGEAAAARGQTRADAAAKAAAGVALYKEQHPDATPAQLEAVRTGVMQAVPTADKNAPSEVRLAKAFVDAGLVPDMKAGLEMAVTKKSQAPAEMHKEFVAAALKNSARQPERAVQQADAVMRSMGYTKSASGAWAAGEGSAAAASGTGGVPAAADRKVGQTYDTPRGMMIWRGNGWEPAK